MHRYLRRQLHQQVVEALALGLGFDAGGLFGGLAFAQAGLRLHFGRYINNRME